jgi:hypothetical protein
VVLGSNPRKPNNTIFKSELKHLKKDHYDYFRHDMKNAKEELLKALERKNIKTTWIVKARVSWEDFEHREQKFKVFQYNEIDALLEELDQEYDDGYGSQELFGDIILSDGSWLSRREYDGSEWWGHFSMPKF